MRFSMLQIFVSEAGIKCLGAIYGLDIFYRS